MKNKTPYEQLLHYCNPHDWANFRRIRNKVNTDTKSGKELYFKNKFEVLNVWKSYVWTKEWRIKMKDDHQSYTRNFCSCEKKDWKKNAGWYGIRILDLCGTGAALYQLS